MVQSSSSQTGSQTREYLSWVQLSFLLLLICLSSCYRAPLAARREYLNPGYLASTQVNTPDPARSAFLGEQIVIQWNVPVALLAKEPTGHLTVRFVNRTLQEFDFAIAYRRGYHVATFLNEEDLCKGGILSYKIDLLVGQKCWYSWRHHLWVDILNLEVEQAAE